MKRQQKRAVLLTLIDVLRKEGSWCGETHLQKALYFLQEVGGVPTDFPIVLYKHGPFSFDLRAELASMRADGLLDLHPSEPPYGPRLCVTSDGEALLKRYPITTARFSREINFVAEKLGKFGVGELERLGTALLISREEDTLEPNGWALKIHEIKPHISVEEALRAIQDVEAIQAEADQTLN